MNLRRLALNSVLILFLAVGAQAASSPVELLRDMFRRPVTEWKEVLSTSKPLLDEQFFLNVEKRIRWGIENNHIDDAFRFAMVGDFGAEIKGKPANFRIDLADLFFQAENITMAGQIVDNILVTSPTGLPAKRATFLRARMLEMQKDLFRAHQLYTELAGQGYEAGEAWFKAGQISMMIQEEKRAALEWEKAVKAGHVQAGVELQRYRQAVDGDWTEIIPPVANDPSRVVEKPPTVPQNEDFLVSAETALEAGDLELAKSKLQSAYQAAPQNPDVVRRMAALLYRMGSLEEAKAFLDSALARSPQDVELLRIRANTEERLYDRSRQDQYLAQALTDYSQAMKLAPNHQFLPLEYERAQAKGK